MEDVLMEGRRGEPGGEACPPAPRYKGKMELFKPAGGFLSEQGCFSRNRTVVSHDKLVSPFSSKKTNCTVRRFYQKYFFNCKKRRGEESESRKGFSAAKLSNFFFEFFSCL